MHKLMTVTWTGLIAAGTRPHSHTPETTKPRSSGEALLFLADRTGLEPATSGVTGRHSNQLNYRSITVEFLRAELVGGDGIEPPTLCL